MKTATLLTIAVAALVGLGSVFLALQLRNGWFTVVAIGCVYFIYYAYSHIWFSVRDFPAAVTSGPLVTGTLTAMTPTRVTVFGHPQVCLTAQYVTQDGQPQASTITRTILKTDLPRYQIGGPVPVRYDPARPDRMMIDLGTA